MNNLFKKIESDKFNHAKKYAQLLSSSESDLLICDDQEFVNDTLNKSIKMGQHFLKRSAHCVCLVASKNCRLF